jgi:hypothetical protein
VLGSKVLNHEDGVAPPIDRDPDSDTGPTRIDDRLAVTGRCHQPLLSVPDLKARPWVRAGESIRATLHPAKDVLANVSRPTRLGHSLVRRIATAPIVAKEVLGCHRLGMGLGYHGRQRVQCDRRRTVGASILVY